MDVVHTRNHSSQPEVFLPSAHKRTVDAIVNKPSSGNIGGDVRKGHSRGDSWRIVGQSPHATSLLNYIEAMIYLMFIEEHVRYT